MESAETPQLSGDPVEPLCFDIGRIGIDKTAFLSRSRMSCKAFLFSNGTSFSRADTGGNSFRKRSTSNPLTPKELIVPLKLPRMAR